MKFLKLFDNATKELANGQPRLLHVDGHDSHITYELLTYAVANNIILLGYPPHTTHILQGLDLVIFSILKAKFHDQVQTFVGDHGKDPSKEDMIDLITPCIQPAFTPENISAAWRASGLRPINPSAINTSLLAPEPQSRKPHAFILPPPSPIANMVADLRAKQAVMMEPTPAFSLDVPTLSSTPNDPTTLFPKAGDIGDPLSLLTSQLSAVDLASEPNPFNLSPTYTSNPQQITPSLQTSLSGTRAEFLLSPATIHSSDKVPELAPFKVPVELYLTVKQSTGIPSLEDWKLIRQAWIDLYHSREQLLAKMVLQEVHLSAVQRRLAEKEKPKKISAIRHVIGLEMNNILTSQQVMEAAEKDHMERLAKKQTQEARRAQMAHNKGARQWRKDATKRKKAAQAVIDARYKQDVAAALGAGKRRPPKPAPAPREATPQKYKVKKVRNVQETDEEATLEEPESDEESQVGGDDDSYIG